MKIAVISTPIFKLPVAGYSGLEVIAYEQARGLAVKGHDVLLIAPDGSECPGVTVIPCGPAGQIDERMAWGGFPEHKEGDKLIRRAHAGYWQALLDVDAIVDHSWAKWSYSLKAERRINTPILGWFHAPVNTMYQQWPPNFPRYAPVEKACPVCISKDQADHFRALHNRDVRVCYNGFDPGHYDAIPGVKRSDRFLFLARFSSIKGAALAIESCLKVGVGLDLVGDTTITGEPHYLGHCMRLAEQQSPGWDNSKGKQIIIHGGCNRGETVTWYSKAYCMLHPNRDFREPFGLAPVEAQSCGLPVIAWNHGAMRETVKHGTTGLLVTSMDELCRAVELVREDSSYWNVPMNRLECRNHAMRFTTQNMVNRVEELVKEAIATGGWCPRYQASGQA